MMRGSRSFSWVWVLGAMGVAGVWCSPARAVVVGVYDLTVTALRDTTAEFDVSVSFTADAGEEMVFFSLDVSASDPLLTSNGTDYSNFSFLPSSPLLDDWNQTADFGPDPFLSVAEYETGLAPFTPGNYLLGTLAVDISSLAPGSTVTVSFDGLDSVIGVEPPGQPQLFEFVDMDTTNASATVTKPTGPGGGGAVPEPMTTSLVAMAAAVLGLWIGRRDRV